MDGKVTAIVLAAGQGKRMKSNVQKQYMMLQGKPVLYYALHVFQTSPLINQIILVTGGPEIEYCKKEVVDYFHFTKVVDIIAGGAERYHSVSHGLNRISGEYEKGIVLIHDGARPFVTHQMINDSIETACQCGACTVGMPVKDTIKVVDEEGYGIDTPDRKTMWQIQTPQTFQVEVIKKAHECIKKVSDGNITDDTMLVEKYCGKKVKVIEGSYQNIKITTPEDMILANAFLTNSIE